jgi:hypothetical protein
MTAGFDSSVLLPEEDHLDRGFLARHICALLTDLPADWSVRVGLFGQWGSGKTTVAKWAEKLASNKDEKHVVVWFNPWSASSHQDLWMSFAACILEALDRAGIKLEGTKKLKAALKFRNFKDVPAKLAEFNVYAKAVVGAAGGAIDAFLRIGSEDVTKIRSKLGERRLIIVVDDVDRVDPILIPQLLLSLREVLDLPGFSFLLPFDRERVIAALKAANSAWEGEAFLEKILDFRLTLPEPAPQQRARLFVAAAHEFCAFIPKNAYSNLAELLPPNPRRIKAIVRHLASLRWEVERHKMEEIDWPTIIFSTMLRLESQTFYERYVDATFSREKNPWIHAVASKTGEEDEAKRTNDLLDAFGPEDAEARNRVLAICRAWRLGYGFGDQERVRYQLALITSPTSLTWAEFDSVYLLWAASRSQDSVAEWVRRHAEQRGVSAFLVATELADAVVARYGQELERASVALRIQDHEQAMTNAAVTRTFVQGLAMEGLPGTAQPLLTPSLFERFLDRVLSWIHFGANPADAAARRAECELLVAMAASAREDADLYLETLEAKDRGSPLDEGQRRELLQKIRAVLSGDAATNALNCLTSSEGLREIISGVRYAPLRHTFFDPAGPLWQSPHYEKLCEILNPSRLDPIVQGNAIRWLEIAVIAVQRGIDLEFEIVKRFLADERTVPLIWCAAIQSKLQFRNLQGLREFRSSLVTHGVKGENLPTPEWLLVTAESLGLSPG